MAFLLDHVPPRLHLVIASRADPSMPLARLRARAELVELRAADLRFTPDEAAAYLNGVMGLELTALDVAALEERTEGWVAALQLAALSMQGRDDARRLHRRVRRRRPLHRRLPRGGGAAAPARAGPRLPAADLDPRPPQRIRSATPSPAPTVARACSRTSSAATCSWCRSTTTVSGTATTTSSPTCSEPGSPRSRPRPSTHCTGGRATGTPATARHPTAIGHALAGQDFERAAELVELSLPDLRRDRQEIVMRGWLELLPEEVMQVRPVLSNSLAGAMLSTGSIEGVERHLRDAERWVATPDRARMVVVDEEELPSAAGRHRRPPCRSGAGAGGSRRDRRPRPARHRAAG